MGVASWFQNIFNNEQPSADETAVEQQNTKSKLWQFFQWIGDMIGLAKERWTKAIYRQAYEQDPDTISKIFGKTISPIDVQLSTSGLLDWWTLGIAGFVYRTLKPKDYEDRMEKAEKLYQSTIDEYGLTRQQINILDEKHKAGQIDDQSYQNWVYALAKTTLDNYNTQAQIFGLWQMTNFSDMERWLLKLNDVYTKKKDYEQEKWEIAETAFEIFEANETNNTKQIAQDKYSAYTESLSSAMSEIYKQKDLNTRKFGNIQLSNAWVEAAAKDVAWRLNNEYNELLDARNTVQNIQDNNSEIDYSWELKKLDDLLEKAKTSHSLFLKEYINSVGKEWYTSIDEFSTSFKAKTGKDISWLFTDNIWQKGLDYTLKEQAVILKNRALLKRDIDDISNLDEISDISPIKLISPIREENGKMVFRMPTVLAATSLLRWAGVTPWARLLVNKINDLFHLRKTTEFYNSGMNMLKSAAFNLDQSRDYNLVDITRQAADRAPDALEFFVPIWSIAWVQNVLWKWTTTAWQMAKYSKPLAKAMTGIFDTANKSARAVEVLTKMKPNVATQFLKWLTHTLIDINLINAPFEARNPKEYNAMDAMFDLSFNAAEVMMKVAKMKWPLANELRLNEMLESSAFQETFYKEVAFIGQWMSEAEAKVAWDALPPKERTDARMVAKNMMTLWARFDSLWFFLGIDSKKYAKMQTTIKDIANDARQMMLKRWSLTDTEMSEVVTRNMAKFNDTSLMDDWDKYLDNWKVTQLNRRANLPTQAISTDDNLMQYGAKIESKDKAVQEEWFYWLKAELDDINKQLDEWVGNRDELVSKRNLYVSWLEYYSKIKTNIDNLIKTNTDKTMEGKTSKLLGKLWYKPETDIKKLTDDKKTRYVPIDEDWVEWKSFVWVDGNVYDVAYRRYVHKRYDGSEAEFIILRTNWSEWTIYHRQDYKVKWGSEYIQANLYDWPMEALSAIEKRKVNEDKLQQLAKKTDDTLFDKFTKYIDSWRRIDAVKYINTISDVETTPQWRMIRALNNKTLISDTPLEDTINDRLYNRFAVEVSRAIWKTPNKWADIRMIKEIWRKYDITTINEDVVENILWDAKNIDEFVTITKWYVEAWEEIASKWESETIKDVRAAYNTYTNLSNITNPKVVNQNKETAATIVNEQYKNLEQWKQVWDDLLVAQSEQNLENAAKANYDNSDLTKVEYKAKGMLAGVTKFVNRITKSFFSQANDYLSPKMIEGYKEYMRLNNGIFYRIGSEWKFLHEAIPEKWSEAYAVLTNNLKTWLEKKAKQAALTTEQQVTQWLILTAAEKEALDIWDTSRRYFYDMAFIAKEAFGDGNFTVNALTDYNRWLDFVRWASENQSLFYFVAKTDSNLYKILTDPKNKDNYFALFGEPTTVLGTQAQKIYKINEMITELARMGKGNSVTRWLAKTKIWPEWARRIWNFSTWGMYIMGTTVLNAQLLPSQLFVNGIGLTTDGVYRMTKYNAEKKMLKLAWWEFWKQSDIWEVMKKFGILYDPTEDIWLLPRTINPMGIRNHFKNPKYIKRITSLASNTVNAGWYNITEMSFDRTFKQQRILETLVADRWIKNIDEFNWYIKTLTLDQQQEFIKNINEKAIKRYVYKTGNSFTGLEKFYFGNDVSTWGIATKKFMWTISLLANWWYTHVKSLSDLVTGYNLNRIALNNFESGKWSLKESRQLVTNLLNQNYDYEMLVNKFFFAFNVWRKLDRISNNEIEEEDIMDNISDAASFAKMVHAPFAGFESNPVYRIIAQTIGTAVLAEKAYDLDLNVVQAAWTTFLARIFAEAKRRFILPSSIAKWISVAWSDDDVNAAQWFGQIYSAWKESTAGFGYFLDRDINYYGYTPDMPVTPHSEVKLFMPEFDKQREQFMKLSTLKQLAELQKTDKTNREYFKYRMPIFKEIYTWMFGDQAQRKWLMAALFGDSPDTNVQAYTVNTPKRWDELMLGELNLDGDLEAWSYVFDLLAQHANQWYTDKAANKWTKQFLADFSKQSKFFTDDWKLLPDAPINNKEKLWINNMFRLADEGKMASYFNEFTKVTNGQKQGIQLLALFEALMDAQWEGANVPWAQRMLISSIAQDMYYEMSNKVKDEKWYDWGTPLHQIDPTADAQIKYYIADKLWDTLYHTDKDSRVTLWRYYARDRAIKEGSDIVKLLTPKYTTDENGKAKLTYGTVKVIRDKLKEDAEKRNNVQGTAFNDLYLLTNILAAEWKLTWDRMYVGLSSILSPKNQKATYDPATVNMTMAMTKVIAETIDNSVMSTQDKASSKAWLCAALIPYMSKVTSDVIETIGEDRYRQFQDWVRWAFNDVNTIEYEIGNKLAQDNEYNWPTSPTWTLLDLYNRNGNYNSTFRSSDPVKTYNNNKKYYDTVSKYYRNNYAKIPKTSIKLSSTYGKSSYYKNLYIKLTDAISEFIPWWLGRWKWPTTGYVLKWSKPGKWVKLTTKKRTVVPGPSQWLIDKAKWAGLVFGTRTNRTAKYPMISKAYIETKWWNN